MLHSASLPLECAEVLLVMLNTKLGSVVIACVLASTAGAQLRRYDASTGGNIVVSGSVVPVSVPRGIQKSPVAQKQQNAQPKPLVGTSAPPVNSVHKVADVPSRGRAPVDNRGGELLVFTTTARLDKKILQAVHELREQSGLPLQIYVEDQDPKIYFRMFQRLGSAITEHDSFKPDSNQYLATKYRITQPNSVVYVSAKGTVRVYDVFDNLENLLRQIKEGR
jgi:hypothetical protein